MLDDPCYFLSFDSLDYAVFTWLILNSWRGKSFLKSITFPYNKKVVTKEVLMGIEMGKIAGILPVSEIENGVNRMRKEYGFHDSLG